VGDMAVNFKLEGLDQVQSKLDLLANPKKAKSIARKAARQAMNIARDVARSAARNLDDPITSEKIYKEIVVRGGKSRDSNSIVIKVGVRGGAKMPYVNSSENRRTGRVGKTYQVEGKVFYWRFLEFGTSRQPATPFLRPALSNNIDAITNKFSEVFSAEIDKELAL
jgi:HK97 gp10 family phage protein